MNKFLIDQRFPKKQKFYKPAINKGLTTLLYELNVDHWNSTFFKDGKFVNKGSKKLSIQIGETFKALLAKMNAELKINNFSIKNPETHNFYNKPYQFSVRTYDISNLLMKSQSKANKDVIPTLFGKDILTELMPDLSVAEIEAKRLSKNTIAKGTIKKHLYRLRDAGIITMKYRRSKYGYDIIINPKILRFNETFTKSTTPLKSAFSKSKESEYPIITIIKYKSIKNKTTNQPTDFNLRSSLHTNSNNNNLDLKKTNQVNSGGSDEIIKKEKEIDTSSAKFQPYTEEDRAEALENSINSHLSLAEILNPEISDKNRKRMNDGKEFRKKVIINFYVFMLNLLFESKSFEYSPENSSSKNFVYTLQSIEELSSNPLYFGSCKTFEEFENKANFLKYVVKETKNKWMKKRKNFNMEWVYPNRYIMNNNVKFNFDKTVLFYQKKLKKKQNAKPVPRAEKIFTKKQFLSALIIVSKLVNRDGTPPNSKIFQKFIKVRYENGQYRCKAHFDYETFRFMQKYIEISRIKINVIH